MEETTSEAINKYCAHRQHQLNTIDESYFASGDASLRNELKTLRIADKFPILNEWVVTLTKANADLIKTIKDVEQTIVNNDNDDGDQGNVRNPDIGVQQLSDESKPNKTHQRLPMKRKKSKNKMLTMNSENNNNHTISRSSPAARKISSDDAMYNYKNGVGSGDGVDDGDSMAKDVNKIGFCKNLLKRMFTKEKCDERGARPVEGYGNGRINYVEFVYIDKSVCCMSTIINEKLTNTMELTTADTLYADFKANCTDRMQTLHHVTTALKSSLRDQELMSAQQLEEIEELRTQIKRLKKYRRSNRMLEANLKSICSENAHLLVEAKKIETQLRLLTRRHPDDQGTT